MQRTVGILRHFRAFSTPEQNPALEVLSTPAPPPLTQTVGTPLAKQKESWNRRFVFRQSLEMQIHSFSGGSLQVD